MMCLLKKQAHHLTIIFSHLMEKQIMLSVDLSKQHESFLIQRIRNRQSAITTHYSAKVGDSCIYHGIDGTIVSMQIIIEIYHCDGEIGRNATYKRRFNYNYDFKHNVMEAELESTVLELLQDDLSTGELMTYKNCPILKTLELYEPDKSLLIPPSLEEIIIALNDQNDYRKKDIRPDQYNTDRAIYRTNHDISCINNIIDRIEEFKNAIAAGQ